MSILIDVMILTQKNVFKLHSTNQRLTHSNKITWYKFITASFTCLLNVNVVIKWLQFYCYFLLVWQLTISVNTNTIADKKKFAFTLRSI